MKYYTDIKKNELMTFAITWVDSEIVTLNEVRQMNTDILLVCGI